MKYIAYTVYVVTVLLISGFARANAATLASVTQTQYQAPVTIIDAVVDPISVKLFIDGSLPNPCYGTPSAILTQDSTNTGILVVRMTAPIPVRDCIATLKYFNSDVELPRLVHASRVKIDAKATYVLKVDGSDYEVQIPGSALLN